MIRSLAIDAHLGGLPIRLIGVLVSSVCLVPFVWGADESVGPTSETYFNQRVLPLLQQHCFECHSHESKKAKGGLVLDSRRGWEVGGESGPAISPGDPTNSLLIKAVQYEDLEMPPKGRLQAEEIEILRAWVTAGAVDPRKGVAVAARDAFDLKQGRKHWAFQPLLKANAPDNDRQDWGRGELDRFVLAKLEASGLAPVADADSYTWLRRVSLDLAGLPPTQDEIEAFVNDSSSSRRERVVGRLLASRAFGEKWARHWLDLVGFADQVGTSNNVFAEHAWRYRDYVIDAFNHDKPFDEFIREQIAGDLLTSQGPEQRAQRLTATGFLVLGDVEIVEADKAKLLVDIVDQQLNKVGKAFMAMTLECARCHDHKFDPISQRDYFAMAGFFHSTSSIYKTDRGVWSDINVSNLPETFRQVEERQARLHVHDQRLARWEGELAAFDAQVKDLATRIEQSEGNDEQKKKWEQRRGELQGKIQKLNRDVLHAKFFRPRIPVAHTVRDHAAPSDMRMMVRGNPRALRNSVPRGFLEVLGGGNPDIASHESGRRQLADWIVSQPLSARVVVNRVWQKLFGEGLVRSVDYFGVPSDQPSHPELLDALAGRFVRQGWSQKALIREIVLSRTYGLSSGHSEQAHRQDPENRFLWRMNRIRLDAEAIRDSMLLVSGQLKGSPGGPALPLEYPENVGGLDPKDVNPPSFRLARWRPGQELERTIFLPVIRHAAQPKPAGLRNVFDFAQPSSPVGRRSVTAVPTQALFLMNSSEVAQYGSSLAESLPRDTEGNVSLEGLWLRVLGRPIQSGERRMAEAFLESEDGDSLAELCRALLASNEFLMRL